MDHPDEACLQLRLIVEKTNHGMMDEQGIENQVCKKP